MSSFLEHPKPDLQAWVSHFRSTEIPVLANTASALEALRRHEDLTDANSIGEMIATDPLMSLKVLAHAAEHRNARVLTDPETVTAALVMMGISPFFAAFGVQPTVEDRLAKQPQALEGLSAALECAHRGANFALAFAVHRMDNDAPVIHAAALLHDFTEMLLWCHAPVLARRLRQASQAEPTLRSGTIQQQVLNIDLTELRKALITAWRLPELLTRISDERQANNDSVKSVRLGVRLAHHTAQGWDNAAISNDLIDIATLLNLSPEAALELARSV